MVGVGVGGLASTCEFCRVAASLVTSRDRMTMTAPARSLSFPRKMATTGQRKDLAMDTIYRSLLSPPPFFHLSMDIMSQEGLDSVLRPGTWLCDMGEMILLAPCSLQTGDSCQALLPYRLRWAVAIDKACSWYLVCSGISENATVRCCHNAISIVQNVQLYRM